MDRHDRSTPIDWLLEDLVAAANRSGASTGVSIGLEGVLVTGTLIGVKEYFYALGDALASAVEGQDAEAADRTRANYREIGDRVRQQYLKYEAAPDTANASGVAGPTYFHMRDAKIVGGQALIPTVGALLFRGRLDAVSGFALGILSVAPPKT